MEYNATSLSKPNNVRDLVAQEVPGLLYNVWTDRQITTMSPGLVIVWAIVKFCQGFVVGNTILS